MSVSVKLLCLLSIFLPNVQLSVQLFELKCLGKLIFNFYLFHSKIVLVSDRQILGRPTSFSFCFREFECLGADCSHIPKCYVTLRHVCSFVYNNKPIAIYVVPLIFLSSHCRRSFIMCYLFTIFFN